jgi:hypothetical protein
MKDSEKELNYLLDKIRFEIEENGGVHLKSYIDFENSFQLEGIFIFLYDYNEKRNQKLD